MSSIEVLLPLRRKARAKDERSWREEKKKIHPINCFFVLELYKKNRPKKAEMRGADDLSNVPHYQTLRSLLLLDFLI